MEPESLRGPRLLTFLSFCIDRMSYFYGKALAKKGDFQKRNSNLILKRRLFP